MTVIQVKSKLPVKNHKWTCVDVIFFPGIYLYCNKVIYILLEKCLSKHFLNGLNYLGNSREF